MKRGLTQAGTAAGFTIASPQNRARNRSGGRRAQKGFTIVETMIVLAITGFMFVIIATTWSGRQHANEFANASHEINSKLQQTISEVQAGYFPSSTQLKCDASGSNLSLGPAASQDQGTNQDCVFLGKVVQFHIGSSDPEQFRIYSVAGIRDIKTADPTIITNANPTMMAPDSSGSSLPDLSEAGRLQYGLTTVAMKSGGANVAAVGFLSQPGGIDSATGIYKSGTQPLQLYAVKTQLTNTYNPSQPYAAVNDLNHDLNDTSKFVANQPVQICFKSGGTNQYALVTIGQDGSQLTSALKVMDGSHANCDL